MKKLEKLKGKKPFIYWPKFKEKCLENLQLNKYVIFKYTDENGKEIWKFIKTMKITSIEATETPDVYEITTTVEGKKYRTSFPFYITKEFTLAKVMCDEKNGIRKKKE